MSGKIEDVIYIHDSDDIEEGEIIDDEESDKVDGLWKDFSWSDLNVLMVGDERILSLCWTELHGFPRQELFYQPGGTTKDICNLADMQISEKHNIVIIVGFHYDLCYYEFRKVKQIRLREQQNCTDIVRTVIEYSAKWKKMYPKKYFIWVMPFPVNFYKHNQHLKGSGKTVSNDRQQVSLTQLYYTKVETLFNKIVKSDLSDSFVFNVNKLPYFEHIFYNLSDYLFNGLFPEKDICQVFAYYFVEFVLKVVFSSKNLCNIDLDVAEMKLRHLKKNYSCLQSDCNLVQPIASSNIMCEKISSSDINTKPSLSDFSCHPSAASVGCASISSASSISLSLSSSTSSHSSRITFSSSPPSRTSNQECDKGGKLKIYSDIVNKKTKSKQNNTRFTKHRSKSPHSKYRYSSSSPQNRSKKRRTHSPQHKAKEKYRHSSQSKGKRSRSPGNKSVVSNMRRSKSPLGKGNKGPRPKVSPESESRAPRSPLDKLKTCSKSKQHHDARSQKGDITNSKNRSRKSAFQNRTETHNQDKSLPAGYSPTNDIHETKISTNTESVLTSHEQNKPLGNDSYGSKTIPKSEPKTCRSYDTTNSDEEIQFWKALKRLKDVHDVECEVFRKNPSSHPSYPREKIKFFDDYYIAKTAKCKPWDEFWMMRMEELFQEKWNSSKIQLSLECSKVVKNKFPMKTEPYRIDSPLQPPDSTIVNEINLGTKSIPISVKKEESENMTYTSGSKMSVNLDDCRTTQESVSLQDPSISSLQQTNIEEEIDFDMIMEDPIFKQGLDDIDVAIKTVFNEYPVDNCSVSTYETVGNSEPIKSSAVFPCANAMNDCESVQRKDSSFNINRPTENITSNTLEQRYNCENKKINTEFLYIMKMLSRLSKQLGPLGNSILEIYSNAKTSYDSTNNALVALDADATAVLDLVGNKIKHLLNSEISIIQKAIFGEVLERTRHFLTDLRFHSTKFPKVDMKNIAITIKDRDVASAIDFIKSTLLYYGYSSFSGNDLMDIYKSVQNW